jgi:hypothetical protein
MSQASSDISLRPGRRLTKGQALAQQEIARLEQIISDQAEQLHTLRATIEHMTDRENELRDMLLDAHDQLLRRDDELLATLEASLRQQMPRAHLPIQQSSVREADPRPSPNKHLTYQQVIRRIYTVVRDHVPPQATVIVVSKGDNELLQLDGRSAWHFPQLDNGVYAGYYPVDSAAAIAHLEALRAKGGQFLLFPQTAFWWLEHYPEFKQYLESRYQSIVRDEESCLIFKLQESASGPQLYTTPDTYTRIAVAGVEKSVSAPQRRITPDRRQELRQALHHIRALVRDRLPPQATLIVVSKGDEALLDMEGRTAWHFPQTEDGRYTSYYPAESAIVIHQIEALRARGGQFLLFPDTSLWWLRYYPELHHHLDTCYRCICHDEHCVIYDLRQADPDSEPPPSMG